MRRYVKPNQLTELPKPEVDNTTASDVSISRLLNDGLVALHREIKNILTMSAKGKLQPNDARDLRDHLKLLFELKDRENELLRNLTDDELKEQARGVLDESK